MRIRFCLDSGAYSLFTTKALGYDERGRMIRGSSTLKPNYAFYKTKEFEQYVYAYMDYVKYFGEAFEFHVTVDVIRNPEMTDHVLQWFDDAGLVPIPVFHYGSDWKWLEKWTDKYPYIGIGGVTRDTTLSMYIEHGNKVFRYLGNTKDVKTHGFALTAYQLLTAWPWYSVDSTSPSVHGRFGNLMVPKVRFEHGRLVTEYDYEGLNNIFVLSERRRNHDGHFLFKGEVTGKAYRTYFESLGTSYEELSTSHLARDVCNYVWIDRFLQRYKEQHGRAPIFYKSGKYSSAPTKVPDLIRRMADNGVKELNYMGTYFRLDGMRVINKLLDKPVFLTIRQYNKAVANGQRRPKGVSPALYPRFKPKFHLSAQAGIHASDDQLLLRAGEQPSSRPRLRL